MLSELYKTPAGEEIEAALEFLSRGIAGAEAYTFLRLNRDHLPEGRLWCAFSGGGAKSVIYNTGDRTVITETGVFPYPGLRLMRFAGKPPAPDPLAAPLALKDAREIYKIIGGKTALSPDEETRYVFRARAMRDGLSLGFGVKENETLLSFAFIAAQNEDSALIGDVFTRPAHRNRGFASAAVLACVFAAQKAAYIVCEEKNAGFYQKLGFEETK